MKRISVILLTLTLLTVFASSAWADEIDLSARTDAEILELHELLNQELVKRNIEKTAELAKGKYIAGKDIPVGAYVYTCLAEGDDWGNVTVYADNGDGSQRLWEIVSAPKSGQAPETIFMILDEGDELESGVPFSLTISAGVVFR